jgi:Cu+-exporting ATPase
MQEKTATASVELCYHCGESFTDSEQVVFDSKSFCCEGCKMVYGILSENDLCTYYDLSNNPGSARKVAVRKDKFAFLDGEETIVKLVHFKQENKVHVKFYVPQMHCSSCVWLLEYLHKLDAGIIESRADFTRKECNIIFDEKETSLRAVAELLTSVGYEPHISLNDIDGAKQHHVNRKLIYQLGVAGFSFGNIMLLSFPEYLSIGQDIGESGFRIFSYLNLLLGSIVFFFPARQFFTSAWKGMRQKHLNIDAPVALAILITYGRSVFDILTNQGAGFMDSMSGIVFFMLIGRFYQDYSQRKLSFDRDFKSFFPAAVNVFVDGKERSVTLDQLKEGDVVKIHHQELIPADGILIKGYGKIDYSFVTGESEPQTHKIGELLYAGGRQVGQVLEVKLTRPVSQSYLTSLWEQNKANFSHKKVSFVHELAKNFTLVLFVFVALTALFWLVNDPSKIFNTVTAMLIIACPCALLLAVTFTNGTIMGLLSKNGLFLRNPVVLESLADADTVVLDKTGTITRSGEAEINYLGETLSIELQLAIAALSGQSVHPLSRGVHKKLREIIGGDFTLIKEFKVSSFEEQAGKGIQGVVNGLFVRIGSAKFLDITAQKGKHSQVHIEIDGQYKGAFEFKNQYRKGLKAMLQTLSKRFNLALLSGDKPTEKEVLATMFPAGSQLMFEQLPEDKRAYIAQLQSKGHKTIMVGDGLNDAIALGQSNAGIAVTDDTNLFSPACDGILVGEKVTLLPKLIDLARANQKIIYITFGISIIYNAIGLYFAVQGLLSPLIAAIIMPSMTVSIVLITTLSGNIIAYRKGLKTKSPN